jgi:hypothetical protein
MFIFVIVLIFLLVQPLVHSLQIAVAEHGGRMFGSPYPGGPVLNSLPENDYPSEGLSVRLDKRRNVAQN